MRQAATPCSADIGCIAVAPTQASAIGHCHVSGAQFDIGQIPPWPSPNKAIALHSLFCRRRHGGPSNHGYLGIGSSTTEVGFRTFGCPRFSSSDSFL
jgi:hypothetical protein